MRCQKCKSEMFVEKMFDYENYFGSYWFIGWKCLICGEISDPVIEANRKREIPFKNERKRRSTINCVSDVRRTVEFSENSGI